LGPTAQLPQALNTLKGDPLSLTSNGLLGDGVEKMIQIDEDSPANSAALHAPEEETIEEMMGITIEFESRLRLFKYLLFASGLHVKSRACYVWFLRTVVWTCTVLCLINVVMQTRSYRHPLFDIVLVMLHIWVSVQYEYWKAFMHTTHWKSMMDIVTRHGSKQFSKRVAIIGYLACLTVPGASAAITTGWLAPMVRTMLGQAGTDGATDTVWSVFLCLHGGLMVVIVVPWACVCLCGVFLFHLVVLAHTTDLEVCLTAIRKLIKTTMNAESYASPIDIFQATRDRLRVTCSYFSAVYASAVFISLLMVMCGGINLAWRVMAHSMSRGADHLNSPRPEDQRPNDIIFQYTQDLFYTGLGLVALYCALYTTVKLTHHWDKFMQIVDDFPTETSFKVAFTERGLLIYHSLLVQYLRRTKIGYYVFGVRMTGAVAWNIISLFTVIAGIVAVALVQITSF